MEALQSETIHISLQCKGSVATKRQGDHLLRSLGLAGALAIFWILLSGYWLTLIVTLGVASIALCVWIAHRLEVTDHEGYPIQLTARSLAYFPWLLKEIVVSNIAVAKAILGGNQTVKPQVLVVSADQSSDLGVTVYANSITLTPGTVTIAVDDETLVVHALMDETADGLRTGDMSTRVCRFVGDPDPAAPKPDTPPT